MLAILPVVAFCAWVVGFRRSGLRWRRSLVFASIPCGLFCVYSTEFLSGFHELTRLGVSLSWLVCAGFAVGWLVVRDGTSSAGAVFDRVEAHGSSDVEIDGWDRAALYFAAGLVAIVALTALVSAPNTWDAMTYHLPRIVQWMGNKSVQNYPTIDRQQLTMPPMAEYVMLHLDLLYGSDRLVNLVQWFAYAGCILGVSLVTEEFGGSRKAQAFAAVVATTIPTALLGASGAKNESVLAYWIVLTVYFLAVWKKRQSWWLAVAIGATGSLAAFTKGTAYTFMPCLLFACWMMWDGSARRRFLLRLPVLALLLLSVCGPLWVRNYQMTGSVFGLPYFDGTGDVEGRKYANSHISPTRAMAGVLRNGSLNLSVPSDKVNAVSTRVFCGLIKAIGVDPNDFGQLTRNPNGTGRPFQVQWAARDEILSANQLTFLLFVLACVFYAANYRKREKDLGWLVLGVIGSFTMYATMLRWAPWNGRYQLSLLMLTAAFSSLVLMRFWSKAAIRATMFVLLLLSLPLATMNIMRPWVSRHGVAGTLLTMPRNETYFLDDHQRFAESFIAAAHAPEVKGCRSIGLDATLLHFEYPMMAIIRNDGPDHRFQYLSVKNSTVVYTDAAEPPACAVICLGCAGSVEKLNRYGANPVAQNFGGITVFSNGGGAVVYREAASPDPR